MHSTPGPRGAPPASGGGSGGGGDLVARQQACYSALYAVLQNTHKEPWLHVGKDSQHAREVCYVDNPPKIRG